MRGHWLVLASLVALGGWEPFRAPDPDVEEGNRAVAEKRWDDALAAYDRAARRGNVDADGLAYDRGTAELGKAEATKDATEKSSLVERALGDLKQAGKSIDPRVRGQASYNRGNALLGQDKLDDAIDAYKQALRDDPLLDDARVNLELALRRRQKQQKQQQGQGQGQQGQQGQQPGQQGQQPGQQGQQPGQQGQQPGQQGQQPGQQGQQPGQQGQQPGQQGQQQGQQGQQQGQQGQQQGQQGQQQGQQGQQQGQQGQQQGQQGQQGQQDQQQQGQNGQPSRQRRPHGRSLNGTPPPGSAGDKLDKLENDSRRLEKMGARRRSTGKSVDPEHDW